MTTPRFVPMKDNDTPKESNNFASEIQKAKDAAEIQKFETQRIESQRQAILAQNDIKDTEYLKTKLAELKEQEIKLAKDSMEFDNRKAAETSEIQKVKAEYERRLAEIAKREQDLSTRTKNVELREKLVAEREEILNVVEKQKLKDVEKYNSLAEQLKRKMPRIMELLSDSVNILDRVGYHGLSDGIWDDIDQIKKYSHNGMDKNAALIVQILREDIEDCNNTAVTMAHNPNAYNQADWDAIVDNLEAIYALQSELKPAYLPSNGNI